MTPAPELVSVVIPCYNPAPFLRETLASLSAQTHPRIEVIVVNDGSTNPESLALLKEISTQVDIYLEQPNKGLGAARNTGFREAHGNFVLPLDADDLIEPTCIAEYLRALLHDESAAFAYGDYQVFGTKNYPETTGKYNLEQLLTQNILIYASLIRKKVWEDSGGYDESMRLGYEDWEFWLRLGSRGHFGHHIPKSLFRYRKHGASLYDTALANHAQLIAYMEERHPELYQPASRMRLKARWSPSVCIVSRGVVAPQTIQDVFVTPSAAALGSAPAVVIPGTRPLDENTAEIAALAVWTGHQTLRLSDGSQALSRAAALKGELVAEPPPAAPPPASTSPWSTLHRHLHNAELLSLRSWALHPARSVVRLIPLGVKERINQSAGKQIFDLSFYLRFQPKAISLNFSVVELLEYYPLPATTGRQRLAVIIPHLGPGGAESVLLDILSSLDKNKFEILVVATQSSDASWLPRWKAAAAHVYDLAEISPERMVNALCSLVKNWQCSTVLVQNSLFGYAAIPFIKQIAPSTRTIDVIHALDDAWDQVSATARSASSFDLRVAVSDAVRDRLLAAGTPPDRIRLIRGGIDLQRFRPAPTRNAGVRQILFAGRLDPVKRPLLLVEIAENLLRLDKQRLFQIVVAGDGPELPALYQRTEQKHLETFFHFLGQVDDLAPVMRDADVLILPSRSEGVPLVLLEAMACARPVVASRVGGIPQIVDATCGILVDSTQPAAAFAAALDLLLRDPDRRDFMGHAGRKRVEASYDLRTARAAYAEILETSPCVDS
jgi:glycosyltransferase involved in cell wall biosynthesis